MDELIQSQGGLKLIEHSYNIHPIVGLLAGALDDLEKGFLLGQEYFIAGEVFDSVLDQAKHLTQHGYQDPAAVLARVVLEDALKRIARGEGIDDTWSASRINDELKRIGRHPQPRWRQIQRWLDIGNSAAHGQFSDYNKEDVEKLIEDVTTQPARPGLSNPGPVGSRATLLMQIRSLERRI